MVSRVALLAATLGGCNWVFALDAPGRADAGTADAAALDAPLGPWGARRTIPSLALTTALEEDPFLDPAQRELYSTVHDPVTLADIRVSAWDGNAWQAPAPVAAVNTNVVDSTPRLSFDGLTLYLSSTRPGGAGGADVWMATRGEPGGAWSGASLLPDPAVNGAANDRTLTECAGGRRVFASDRNNLRSDVFEEIEGVAFAIGAASDKNFNEVSPFISRDCLTLYFASDAAGLHDLYVATRTSPDLPFETAVRIDELSQPDTGETDPWVSPDGRHIVFSVINAMQTDIDVYEADR